jgi:hypothetical protein
MKKNIFPFMLLLLLACQDELPTVSESQYKTAILSYLDEKKEKAPNYADQIEDLKMKINFSKVSEQTIKNGQKILISKVGELNSLGTIENSTARVVFFLIDERIVRSEILLYESGNLTDIQTTIIRMYSNTIHEYDGIFSVYNIFQKLRTKNTFEKGKVVKSGVVRPKQVKSSSGGRTNSCIDWYLVTTVHYMDGSTSVTEQYVGRECDDCVNNETRSSEVNCGGGDGGQTLPSNPAPGTRWSITNPSGIYREFVYVCSDWGCTWRADVMMIPAAVVETDRNNWWFLPLYPPPNTQKRGPVDGLTYDYNANFNNWTAQALNRLCGGYSFGQVGEGMGGTIINLAATAVHEPSKERVDVMWGSVCVTFGSSTGITTSEAGTEAFNTAWNIVMDEYQTWLNIQGDVAPLSVEAGAYIKERMFAHLWMQAGGYVSLEWAAPCQGNLPQTVTRYCN